MRKELDQDIPYLQGSPDPEEAMRELHREDMKELPQDLLPVMDSDSQSDSQVEDYPRVSREGE